MLSVAAAGAMSPRAAEDVGRRPARGSSQTFAGAARAILFIEQNRAATLFRALNTATATVFGRVGPRAVF